MRILGIESSCDETAASVVDDGIAVRSNVIASQHDLHAEYAGVVPEIASRAHAERIGAVIDRAGLLVGLLVGRRVAGVFVGMVVVHEALVLLGPEKRERTSLRRNCLNVVGRRPGVAQGA